MTDEPVSIAIPGRTPDEVIAVLRYAIEAQVLVEEAGHPGVGPLEGSVANGELRATVPVWRRRVQVRWPNSRLAQLELRGRVRATPDGAELVVATSPASRRDEEAAIVAVGVVFGLAIAIASSTALGILLGAFVAFVPVLVIGGLRARQGPPDRYTRDVAAFLRLVVEDVSPGIPPAPLLPRRSR